MFEETKIIKGVFYYAGSEARLSVLPGINGGKLFAKVAAKYTNLPSWETKIPTRIEPATEFSVPLEVNPNLMNLNDVVTEVAENGNACPTDGTVTWNEEKIIQ